MSNTRSEEGTPAGGLSNWQGSDATANQDASTLQQGLQGARGAHSGADGVSPEAAAAATTQDAGDDIAADMDYGTELRTAPDPMQGIATRAAQEGVSREDPDNPEDVPGDADDVVTPGYSP